MHDLLRATPQEASRILANARTADPVDEDLAVERAFYGRLELHLLDGRIVPLPAPTAEELNLHLSRFMPKTRSTSHTLTSLQKLHRQAVQEIADLYDVDMSVESKTAVWTTDEAGKQVRDRGAEARLSRSLKAGRLKLKRRTTDEMRREAHELAASGLTALAVAKRLNISDSRVKAILRESAPPELLTQVV